MTALTRAQVVAFRWGAHQLDREPGSASAPTDVDILDLGVQDTGPDGAGWALALRGVSEGGRLNPNEPARIDPDLALAWTLRGAPHVYRRSDLPAIVTATAPYSETDAARRIYGAAKPLKAAQIHILDALENVARKEREIVVEPMVKGDLSTRLTDMLDEPFLRWCNPCQATHCFEMPFRLAALQAGLELIPNTSPPVLQRIPATAPTLANGAEPYQHLAEEADPRFDVIRNYLRFYGPASYHDVAAFLDAPVADVKTHWPTDAVPVALAGVAFTGPRRERWMLADDAESAASYQAAHPRSGTAPVVRLAGPYDPYLQLRDRTVLVADPLRAKELWPVLGRPGAVLCDGEVVGSWRPRTARGRLNVVVDEWFPFDDSVRDAVHQEIERLREFRSPGKP